MNNIEIIENNAITSSKSIFRLNSSFTPTGDQPEAIKELVSGIQNDEKDQVLLGLLVLVKHLPWRTLLIL